MTGRAARCDRAFDPRLCAVTPPAREAGLFVSRWCFKRCDVPNRQPLGSGEWHVARRARTVGRGEMSGPDGVAVEAALRDRRLHGHPRSTLIRVAVHAPDHRLAASHKSRRVLGVLECQIVSRWLDGRPPRDGLLNLAVVARRARRRIGPQRRAGARGTSMTGGARGEQLLVLRVIEAGRRLLSSERAGNQQRRQGSGQQGHAIARSFPS